MHLSMKEYQKLAMRTSNTHGRDQIENGLLGLIGETGELVDVWKKTQVSKRAESEAAGRKDCR